MIVYIESNFILEIALQQEQSLYAENILGLATQGEITLAFPDFALSEPFATVMHRNGERKKISNNLIDIFKEIRRSKSHGQIMMHAGSIMSMLRDVEIREWEGLHGIVAQLLHIGIPIPCNAKCLEQALVYRTRHGLSSQDAFIYASIMADVQKHPQSNKKCFLSRDRRAFGQDDDRTIKAELDAYNCRYIGSFLQGLDYIQSTLQSAG